MEFRKVLGLVTGLSLMLGGIALSPVTDPVSCFDVLWTVEGDSCVTIEAVESGLFLLFAVIGAVLTSLMIVDILHSSIDLDGESRMIDPAFVRNKDKKEKRGLEGPNVDTGEVDSDTYDVRMSGGDIATGEKKRQEAGDSDEGEEVGDESGVGGEK